MNLIGHCKIMNTDKDPDSIVKFPLNDIKKQKSFDTGILRNKTIMTGRFWLEEYELDSGILKKYSKW